MAWSSDNHDVEGGRSVDGRRKAASVISASWEISCHGTRKVPLSPPSGSRGLAANGSLLGHSSEVRNVIKLLQKNCMVYIQKQIIPSFYILDRFVI